jgi:hypothetical protein
MGVTDKSAIGGETLCVVTIGPVADMRIVGETPDAKVVARGGKYGLLCVERKRGREKESTKKIKQERIST